LNLGPPKVLLAEKSAHFLGLNTSITCRTTAVAIIITFKQVEGADRKLFIYSTNTRDLSKEQVVAKHIASSFRRRSEIEMVLPLRVMAAALTNRSDVHRVFEFIGTVGEKAVAIMSCRASTIRHVFLWLSEL
jgi:hypothetical protein